MVKTMCIAFVRRGAALAAAVVSLWSCAGSAWAQGSDPGRPGAGRVDANRGFDPWMTLDRLPHAVLDGVPNVRPLAYRAAMLDFAAADAGYRVAPKEGSGEEGLLISLPLPDGTDATFAIYETAVMHPDLGKQYPEIKTYSGSCVSAGVNRGAPVALDITPTGLRASIRLPSGVVYIDPASKGDVAHYVSYYTRDNPGKQRFQCLTEEPGENHAGGVSQRTSAGTSLRTYRLAMAATGEFTAANGGTVSSALAAITSIVNRMNQVYEVEASVRFQLIATNNLIVWTDAGTDPYGDPSTIGSAMLTANQTSVGSLIGSANYDIGHVITTNPNFGVLGIAQLSSVCSTNNKARGASGIDNSLDNQGVATLVHEVGHQFSARHTFNTNGACAANRDSAAAYEPGSGSTIMSYGGGCGDDYVGSPDLYFLWDSFDRIQSFIGAGGCAALSATGNNFPTITALTNRTIPANTPFELTASATDVNGDPLTYTWEQRNLGPAQILSDPDNGTSPIIRSRPGTTSGTRMFPPSAFVLAGTLPAGEKLPILARTMPMRVTVRDNKAGGGGINTADLTLTVVTTAGPLAVTGPNGGEVVAQGTGTVTWNVANTNIAPVNTSQVKIRLSTDGGNTFPTDLGTFANNGSASVTFPTVLTTTARVRVEAVNNYYFDVSNANFTIRPAVVFALPGNKTIDDTQGNGNTNGKIDPGEDTVAITLAVRNDGAGTATGVTATLTSNTPTVTVTQGASAYPSLGAGVTASNSTPFVISVSPSHVCGDPINLSLALNSAQGGAASLPVTLTTGGAGQVYTFTFNGTQAIPDFNLTGTEVTIPVSGLVGTITSLTVAFEGSSCSNNPLSTSVGLAHAKVSDLQGTLFGPDNTSCILFNRPGTAANLGANLCQTIFTDDTTAPLFHTTATTGLAPYTGSFRPSQTLSRYNGKDPNGTWRLKLVDAASGNTGTLYTFSLRITTGAVVCDPVSGGGAGCNIADITGIGGGSPPDGSLTVDDLIEFVNAFSDGSGCPGTAPCNVADITGIGGPPEAPDGALTVDDLIGFVNAFSEGCP